MVWILIRALIQALCLYAGMYYLFNGNKRLRWLFAANVVMSMVNMIRL